MKDYERRWAMTKAAIKATLSAWVYAAIGFHTVLVSAKHAGDDGWGYAYFLWMNIASGASLVMTVLMIASAIRLGILRNPLVDGDE